MKILYQNIKIPKTSGNEFFVAFVRFDDDGQLRVYVLRLSHVDVWYAESRHHIVIHKLALKSFDTPNPLDTSDTKIKIKEAIGTLEELYKTL